MNNMPTTHLDGRPSGRQFQIQSSRAMRALAVGMLALLGFQLADFRAAAQDDIRVRFIRPAPLRQTVSVNTTNVGVFTNDFSLSTNIVDLVTLSVSNLPPNCGYTFATNGVNVGTSLSVSNDVGLSLTLFSTNVPQGEYTFRLWAIGTGPDTGTNYLTLMFQSCYVWQGAGPNITNGFNVNAAWTNNASWVGGNNPGTNLFNDVFFGDLGAQTNRPGGIPVTNITVDVNTTVGSLRFGPGTFTNNAVTNALYHNLRLNNNSTLTVTNGFRLMRDYIAEYSAYDRKTAVNISGGNNARLVVSNVNANVALLLDNSTSFESTLAMTNLGTFTVIANRMGLGDYQLFPNYRELNRDTNGLEGTPKKMLTTVHFARTNLITAFYKDPDNYVNENTRQYGITWLNGEIRGNGSTESAFLALGVTNNIRADSICLVGANHSSGNNGQVRFGTSFDANPFAIFRNTNGTGRMSLFAIADGGGTNFAGSNLKGTVDLSGLNTGTGGTTPRSAVVDLLVDKMIIARDRSSILISNSVNYQGGLLAGRGNYDVNQLILGYQEHQVRYFPTSDQNQLGYCQGTLTVSNQGIFRVNGNITLGYTTDTNAITVAGLNQNRGQIIVNGASLIASNIVVDGGPRNYSDTEGPSFFPRQDSITLVGANLIVSNSIGNTPGRPLNLFSTERSTNTIFVLGGRTNIVCRQLSTPGAAASVIKVAGLTSIGALPATIPIIAYAQASSPFLQADLTAFTNANPALSTNGYLLNDLVNSNISLYVTTNQPKTLVWTGNASSNWDYSSLNWKMLGTGTVTNFAIGDIAIFNDEATRTNVFVVGEVVPGQAGAGVTFSNITKSFTLDGGTVAGTSRLIKASNSVADLTLTANKQGPITILGGTFNVGVGGVAGATTIATNIPLNVYGSIVGGLTSTGTVTVAVGGQILGAAALAAGWLDNSGTIATHPGTLTIDPTIPVFITNRAGANLNLGGVLGTQWSLPTNSVLANHGTINNLAGRLNLYGLMYGNGTVSDPDSTGGGGPPAFGPGVDGRLEVRNPFGLLSPGSAPSNSIGTMTVLTRFDFDGADNQGWGTMLIEVDKTHTQTNDMIVADYWSNCGGKIIFRNLTNLPFANGDYFQVLVNNRTDAMPEMIPDNVVGDNPVIEPTIPGPGLVWDTSLFRGFGVIKVKAVSMVWRGNVNSTWDNENTANWLANTVYTNNVGALFDDTAVNFTVNLISNVAPAGWWIVSNYSGYSNGTVYTTNITAGPVTNISTNLVGIIDTLVTNNPTVTPGIVIHNTNDFFFSGVGQIQGYGGLYKTGPGTLTFGAMSNDFKGTVIIDQGMIVIPFLTNDGVAQPLGSQGSFVANRQPRGSERLIIGPGTLRYTGPSTTTSHGMTIMDAGATLDISNSTANVSYAGNNAVFRGTGPLTKTGAGTLSLRQGGGTFSNLTINSGHLILAAAGAGLGKISFPTAGTFFGLTNNVSVPNDLELLANIIMHNTNTTVLNGDWSGPGNVTITNIAPSVLTFNDTMSNYTGNITIVGSGTNRFNNGTNNFKALGNVATIFDLGASAWLENFNGGDTNGPVTYHLGGLAGGAGASLAGRFSNNVNVVSGSIYSIGAKGVDTVFSGTILNGLGNGTVSIVKVGSGKLTLNGVNTYTGSTTVSNGTLAGNTTMGGSLTVLPGAFLEPGSSVGTMTVASNISLAGTLSLELNKASSPTSDKLVSTSGTITYGGALTVRNIGPALQQGDTFQLFPSAVTAFSSIVLSPTDDTGAIYTWTNKVAIDGSIQVIGVTERIYAVTTGNQLISFGSTAPGTILSAVNITGASGTIVGIDFRTNTLYALGDDSRLYTINRTTGAATAVGAAFSPVLNGTFYGMDVEPAGVRVVTDLDQSLLLDFNSGAAAVGSALNGTPNPTISGLAYNSGNGQFYVADYVANTIGTFDPVTGLVIATNLSGIDFSRNNGFDISAGTNHTAYLATPAASGGASADLYTVNLTPGPTFGAATLVGLIGPAEGFLIRGLAVGPDFSSAGLAIATNPTNISFSVTGGNLNLSWPTDHLGWILQNQTNSRSIGLFTNWNDIAGSASVTATNFPINAADPTVFYRLRKP